MKIFKSLDDVAKFNDKGSSLGAGTFAKVVLVSHKDNPGKLYAMKELEKHSVRATLMIQKEIKLHMTLSHPHIIQFEDYIETPKKVFIFLEYAKHGDMFGYITKHKLSEDECMRFFYQTCEGISYIHGKSIMHRDMKPENILLDQNLNVKIADFGWSAEYLPTECRQTLCGTYEYMAPEIFFRKQQTKKTDIWALGILLYELFHGHAPYRGTKMEEVLASIMKNSLAFKKTIDPSVRSLIAKILNFEPTARPSIEDILASEPIVNFLKKFPQHRVKRSEPAQSSRNVSPSPLGSARSITLAKTEYKRAPSAFQTRGEKENAPSSAAKTPLVENRYAHGNVVIKSRSINPAPKTDGAHKPLPPFHPRVFQPEKESKNLISTFTKLDLNGKQTSAQSFAQFLNSHM